MDENQEKQEKQSNIIESYDGDPDDLVFFQTPKGEAYEESEEDDSDNTGFDNDWVTEEGIEEGIEEEREIPNLQNPVTEVLYAKEVPAEEEITDIPKNGNGPAQIDVNDPHYENYKPDPYYEFGQGPEPELKSTKSDNSQEVLGIVSLVCGIMSIVMVCCGFSFLLSLTALITGIVCLCSKTEWNQYKTMAVIGIVLAVLPAVFSILSFLIQIGNMIMIHS